MSAVSKLLIVAALIVLAPTTSKALVGTVDDADEFPFVVRLESKYPNGATSWCSGVVHGHILSTAGHCLYNAEKGGTAVGVTVPYTDTLGNLQKAYSKKIYIPKSYIADDAEYHNDYRGASHDIAYVTLDRDVYNFPAAYTVYTYHKWGERSGRVTRKRRCDHTLSANTFSCTLDP
jgi:V8-like Glu-specific endopeptidase